jgi:hypothetical protein
MADIVVTATQVGVVYSVHPEIVDVIATEAVTAGDTAYQLSTGKFGIADANAAGKQQFRGIFLKTVGAGQVVPVLKEGFVSGFTVSALNGDAILYLSDTVGKLADGAGTMTVNCGRVFTTPDLTKLVYIAADWLRAWS